MDKSQHPCIECAYFIKPSLWRIYRLKHFAESCGHPQSRDKIDGGPMPCLTVRIMDCDGRIGEYSPQRFRPKQTMIARQLASRVKDGEEWRLTHSAAKGTGGEV